METENMGDVLGQLKNDLLFYPYLLTPVNVTAFMLPKCHVKYADYLFLCGFLRYFLTILGKTQNQNNIFHTQLLVGNVVL